MPKILDLSILTTVVFPETKIALPPNEPAAKLSVKIELLIEITPPKILRPTPPIGSSIFPVTSVLFPEKLKLLIVIFPPSIHIPPPENQLLQVVPPPSKITPAPFLT